MGKHSSTHLCQGFCRLSYIDTKTGIALPFLL